MPIRPLRAVIAACAAAMLAGAAIAAAKTEPAAMVTIRNFDFHPMTLTVPVGAEVTWKNLDGEPHTVTSQDGLFRSGALDEGDSFSFKFTRAGTYRYLCNIHPRMMASVTVK